MKSKLILSLSLIATLFIGCSKDKSDSSDNSPKTVSYVFSPNSANAQVSYTSIQQGKIIGAGYHTTFYSVNDQVKIGDKVHLQMQTTDNITRSFEVRINYGSKQIAISGDIESTGNVKTVELNKTFTAADFK